MLYKVETGWLMICSLLPLLLLKLWQLEEQTQYKKWEKQTDTDKSGRLKIKIYHKIKINIRNKLYNSKCVFSFSGGYPRWHRQLCAVLMIWRRSFCTVFFFYYMHRTCSFYITITMSTWIKGEMTDCGGCPSLELWAFWAFFWHLSFYQHSFPISLMSQIYWTWGSIL